MVRGGGVAIDISTYDKRAKHEPGHGYEVRTAAPTSIVVHSTSNPHQKNTAFSAEAKFLLDHRLASAHYLIGKNGTVVRFLDPRVWAAWHAGNARADWANQKSIGIELHHSVGDAPYPKAQRDALAVLLRSLMALFDIPAHKIETHGQIAIAGPYKRKTDPSDWPYTSFLLFRATLVPDPPPPPDPPAVVPMPYIVHGLPVYERADRTGPLWGHLVTGERVMIDDLRNGHLADGRGFVSLAGLEAV